MTKHIVNSTPTTSLRWVRRGEERVLQQSFAVTTIDDETGHMAAGFEWIEVPTFMEMTHEVQPTLASIKMEFKRDWKHLETLIEQVIAKLDDADQCTCPCGDNDEMWCSLPGCPYPHPRTAAKSTDHLGVTLAPMADDNAFPTMPTREEVAAVLRRFNGHLISHELLNKMTAALQQAFPVACRAYEHFAREKAEAAAAKEIVGIFFGRDGSPTKSKDRADG